jgi:hypothetical protein
MLFDLRSRGRRRTVQGVYLGLALLMGGGLVLFGVGAGNGFGGILNAFNGGGNGGAQKQAVSQQEKQALARTKADPNNPAGWFALVQARYASAGQGNDFNTASSTYTANGRAELTAATQAWQSYLNVTKRPDPQLAVLAARAYDILGQFKSEASAWQIVTAANPKVPTYYENLAVAAYQGKQVGLGDLAAAKAVSLAPKTTRIQLQQQLKQLRSQALGTPSASVPVTPAAPTTSSTPAGAASTPSSSTTTGKKKKK